MLPGIFEQKLRSLNKNIRIFSNGKVQAVYFYNGMNEPEHICGVDRNDIPEFTVYDKQGHIIKAGWRRTLEILIHNKLVNKSKAEILFHSVLDGRHTKLVIEEDAIGRAIKQLSNPVTYKDGNTGISLKRDDLMDISKEIRGTKCKPVQ